MDAACRRGENRKYAANSKHAEHTGMPQRLYLRFLCAKRAVCSWVPEFAAYFRELQTQIESPRSNEGIRDNIQLSRKRQRAVAGKPNNDPSLSSPHVESAMTVSLKSF